MGLPSAARQRLSYKPALALRRHDGGTNPEHHGQDGKDQADGKEDGGDDPENLPDLREGFAFGVHRACRNLLQVRVAHHPGGDADRLTDDESKDAENENECAAMWFHFRTM